MLGTVGTLPAKALERSQFLLTGGVPGWKIPVTSLKVICGRRVWKQVIDLI